jgi:MSHA pilin protein MshD
MTDYSDIIITMAALMIVSVLVINSNRSIIINNKYVIEHEYEAAVANMAQDFIDEAKVHLFDELSTPGMGGPIPNLDQIATVTADLGPDPGETDRSLYDDFDDYNGYTTVVSTIHGDFDISIDVEYVDTNQNTSLTRTTMKQINVTLTNESLFKADIDSLTVFRFSFVKSIYSD